jgi:aminoglycoside phosphotransferase (APT) family kinase protein
VDAGEVRDEDAFDVAAVHQRLRSVRSDLGDALPRVQQFHGGVSNRTYRLDYGPVRLVLRRPPAGRVTGNAHDMGREYRILCALTGYAKAPRPVLHCEDVDPLGSEFLVMEAIDGVILRRDPPPDRQLDNDTCHRLCEALVDGLAELHAVTPPSGIGSGDGYVARQVRGWSQRYRAARTPDAPSFERVIAWLETHQPDDAGRALIHNDYRFDNLVLAEDDLSRVVGVLDWELATVGDPWMDLGCSLAYWVQADDDPMMHVIRRQPTHLPGMWTRREVVDAYQTRVGRRCPNFTFYEVMGLFRLAGIAQQIYRRYHDGLTTNPRFANFIQGVTYFEQRCEAILG